MNRRTFLSLLAVPAAVPELWHGRIDPTPASAAGEWKQFGIEISLDRLDISPEHFTARYIDPALSALSNRIEEFAHGRNIQLAAPELPRGVEYAGLRKLGNLPVIREVHAYDPFGHECRPPGFMVRLDVLVRLA